MSLAHVHQSIERKLRERAEAAEAELAALETRFNAVQEQRDAMYVAYPKLKAREARLREALKRVPIFESDGHTKTCIACGAQHWFYKGPPIVIRHKPDCWAAEILGALAALSDTAQPLEASDD